MTDTADNEACVQPETHIRRWAATVAALTAENERLRERLRLIGRLRAGLPSSRETTDG